MSSIYTPTPVAMGNITLVSDGDARSAASVNVPLTAIADGVKSLDVRLDNIESRYQLVDYVVLNGTFVSVVATMPSPTATAALATAGIATLVGDKVEVDLTSTFRILQDTTLTSVVTVNGYLQANQNGGGLIDIPKAHITCSSNYKANSTFICPFRLAAAFTVATAGTLATGLKVTASGNAGTSDQGGCIDDYVCTLKIWRLTP